MIINPKHLIEDFPSVRDLFKIESSSYFQRRSEVYSKTELGFFAAVFIQAITLFVLAGVTLSTSKSENSIEYEILFLLSVVSMVLLAVDGAIKQNIILLIAFLFFSLLIIIYAILSLTISASIPFIIQLVVSPIAFFVYCFLIYRMYLSYGWSIFTKLGSDTHLRKHYGILQVFIATIKFDMIFSCLLIVMVAMFLLAADDYELYLDIFILLFEFYWSFYGYWQIKEEHDRSFYSWVIFGCLQPLYAFWKINDFTWIRRESKYSSIIDTIPFLSVLSSVSIVVRIGVIFIAFYLKKNFGKGLKEAISEDAAKGRERSFTFVE